MKRTTTTLLTAAALLALPLAASANPSAQDLQFVKLAAQGGMAEVAEATIAQQNGTSPAVKSFAARMLADHGKANGQLMSIARVERIMLPSDIGPTNAKAKGTLQNLHGKTFDTTYLTLQRQAHLQTQAVFQKEIAQGRDMRLIAFAKSVLPTVRAHILADRQDLATMQRSSSNGSM